MPIRAVILKERGDEDQSTYAIELFVPLTVFNIALHESLGHIVCMLTLHMFEVQNRDMQLVPTEFHF